MPRKASRRAQAEATRLAEQREVQAVATAVAKGQLPPTALALPPEEIGITGTINYGGDVQTESNAALIHTKAFGSPGSRIWGAWDDIVRTDPDVACALEFVCQQIRDADLEVEAAKDHPNPALAQQQADFVKWNLKQGLEPGWSEVGQQTVRGMLGSGFALHEVVPDVCQHRLLPGGRGYKVKKIAERLPVSVHINGWKESPETGDLVEVRQYGPAPGGGWLDVRIPAGKLLLASWNRSGNNYLGFSAFRPVWYHCKIRGEISRSFGIAVTRETNGIPVATCDNPDAALEGTKLEELQQFLANLALHENASAVMPAGWKLDWVFSGGADKGHVVDLYNALGQLILRQCSAQQIALGTGATGSRSVGEVHNAVANAFAQGVVATLEAVYNGVGERLYTGLVKRLVRWNWGEQPAYPVLKLTLKKAQLEPLQKMQAIKVGVDAGIITVTPKDENEARDTLGMSPISETERAAAIAAKPPPMLMPGMPVPGGRPPDVSASTPPGAHPAPGAPPAPPAPLRPAPVARATRLAAGEPFKPSRELMPHEKCLDLAAMDSFLNTARDTFERNAKPLVVEMLARLLPDIREAMKDGDPSEVQSLKPDTTRLNEYLGQFLARARSAGAAAVKGERARQSDERLIEKRAEGDQSMAPVRLAAGDEKDDARPLPDDVEAPPGERTDKVLKAQQAALLKRMVSKTLADVETEAIDVVRTGGHPDEVVTRTVMRQLESGALKQDAGSVLTKAFNLGRDEFARQYGAEVSSVTYSAILDGDACPTCDALDGAEFDFGGSDYEANTPPNRECDGRSNCRCIYVFSFGKGGFEKVGDDE